MKKIVKLQLEVKQLTEWYFECGEDTEEEIAVHDLLFEKENELIEEAKHVLKELSPSAYECLCELVESITYRQKAIDRLLDTKF